MLAAEGPSMGTDQRPRQVCGQRQGDRRGHGRENGAHLSLCFTDYIVICSANVDQDCMS